DRRLAVGVGLLVLAQGDLGIAHDGADLLRGEAGGDQLGDRLVGLVMIVEDAHDVGTSGCCTCHGRPPLVNHSASLGSIPSAVARSMRWSCSSTRISRITSAIAYSLSASHCRTRSR